MNFTMESESWLRTGLDTGSWGKVLVRAPHVLQRQSSPGRRNRCTRSGACPIHAAATVACVALLLAACQTPATRTQTVEVKVPVAVQPIKPAQVPAVPAPLGPRPQSLSATADLLLAKHCEWVAYALLTDPLLRVSAGMPQRPLAKYPECER